MFTMIFISSAAMLVGIVGSIVIWRFDALRAQEIEQTVLPMERPALSASAQGRTNRRSAS